MAVKDGKLRAVSNLTIPKEFALPKGGKSKGFIGLYSGSTRRKFKEPFEKLLAHIVVQTLLPQARAPGFVPGNMKRSRLDALVKPYKVKDYRNYATLRRGQRANGQAGFFYETVVGRIEDPLATDSAQYDLLDSMFAVRDGGQMPPNPAFQEVKLGSWTGVEAAKWYVGMKPGVAHLIADCVEKVSVNQFGGSDMSGGYNIYFTFFIGEREAETLTCTPYPAIRLSNLFLMLLQWQQTLWGTTVRLPLASIPLTKVEESVKAATQGKVLNKRNQRDNIVVTQTGECLWIPDVNQISRYESALEKFGLQDDGSYSMKKDGPGATVFRSDDAKDFDNDLRLPANIPVFTDWVNSKFTYSMSTGVITTFDLSRSVPLRAFHVRDLLESSWADVIGQLGVLVNLGEYVKVPFNPVPSPQEAAEAGIIDKRLDRLREAVNTGDLEKIFEELGTYAVTDTSGQNQGVYLKPEEVNLKEFNSESDFVALRATGRWFDAMFKALSQENIRESAYRNYSVMTVCEVMAVLTIINKFGSPTQLATVIQKDEQDRLGYKTQDQRVGKPVEAVPNIRSGMAFLPHQAKAENKLQGSPRLAAIQVDAGGGKSPITLMSILAELGRGTCKLPLIMCPGHLVANYVSEAVYFTEGKVNIIPCTGYTLRQNGLARLEQMIIKAPPNTILITDFDFIKGRTQKLVYGTTPVIVFRNAEWLRQFRIDLVFVDESHLLSNQSSIRTQAAHRILSEIPFKRIESGTMVKDTMLDLPAQLALLDPTILGNETKFRKAYADDEKSSGKVEVWKDNAPRMIKQKMAEHCVVVTAKRKEWAALLPPYDEEFHAVEMTPTQHQLYMSLLDETKQQIYAEAESNPRLKALLEKASRNNPDDATLDSDDDSNAETLAILLKAHLSRLEQFITAPSRDKLGNEVLQGEERISPKVLKIIDICRKHLVEGIYGKILIFTTHLAVAEEIYEQMPPDLKAMTIHYTADRKLECGALFENNPNMKIMVGGETTMNTGLNFQYVSRMIRMETVWTPGILEQGNSRLNRPELKKKDLRERIYFDWVFVNRTFDVTKISRLVAKNLQKAKFDEAYDDRYKNLPNLPMIKMSLDNILFSNDFQEDMMPYLDAHEQLLRLTQEDYAEYREKAKREGLLDENGKLIPIQVPDKGLLEGSKLMARTPYVPQMNLYGAADLGLVRYDEYMRLEAEQDADEDDTSDNEDNDDDTDVDTDVGDEEQEDTTQRALNAEELTRAANLRVHTEFGDGYIQGVNKRTLRVLLDSGELVRPRKIATYVVTRKETNSKDIRNQLLKAAGSIPIDAPIDVPATSMRSPSLKATRKLEEQQQELKTKEALQKGISVSLSWTFVADFLGISCADTSDSTVVAALSQFGFSPTPELYMARLKTAKELYSIFKIWDKSFEWPKYANKRWGKMHAFLKTHKEVNFAGIATQMKVRNFFVMEAKPSADPTVIKPYPLILDGLLHIALPIRGQAGTLPAVKATRNIVAWKKAGGDSMIKFVGSKPEAVAVLKRIMDGGVKVANLDALGKKFKAIKLDPRPLKASEEDEDD